nr:MAG TPA: hypothetical protein [Caudoviricetes sp.]
MSKKEQALINEKVIAMLVKYNEEVKQNGLHHGKRLFTCQAYVYETPSFYVLRSYNTVVAIIEKKTDTCYDFLRAVYGYTNTSAKHISKFDKDYGRGMYGCTQRLTYREV